MPTFDDPLTDAVEVSAALRGLAHATRNFASPAGTYPVLGDVLAGVRSLRQVVDQIAREHLIHRARAHDDDGNQTVGASEALAAADDLQHVANALDGVEQRLDSALGHSGRIAWHPDHPGGDHAVSPPTADPPPRWINVVFLQGDEADVVLDRIDRDGPDPAIEHLTQWDFGEETTASALENGYVYDEPPMGPADKVATAGDYTLTYNALLGHVSLLRAHRAAPDPALNATSTAPGGRAGAGVTEGSAAPAARVALRQGTPGGRKQDWFAPRPVASMPPAMGRSL